METTLPLLSESKTSLIFGVVHGGLTVSLTSPDFWGGSWGSHSNCVTMIVIFMLSCDKHLMHFVFVCFFFRKTLTSRALLWWTLKNYPLIQVSNKF